MCRLLLVNSKTDFEISEYLCKFSLIAEGSKEYQGDGWGIYYMKNNRRKFYHSLKPIWEDNLNNFGKSTLIMVHARSAFEDVIKPIEHNMPFYDNKYSFIFNGELRGVKINEEGRIGAEKIFNFIKRFTRNGLLNAVMMSNRIIEKRTGYIRAMNYIISDSENIYINSFFNEDEKYFTLCKKETEDLFVICSKKFPGEKGWKPIDNKVVLRRRII